MEVIGALMEVGGARIGCANRWIGIAERANRPRVNEQPARGRRRLSEPVVVEI